MPVFQKLLKGALTALAEKQAAMDELGAPARVAIEQLGRAENRFAGQTPDVLRMYHGSPHVFDRFDFENNLKKGEGALAFGPGGYLSGSEGLAREYARTLTARKSGSKTMQGHDSMLEAFRRDPQATAEYLRALNAQKSWANSGKSFEELSRVPTTEFNIHGGPQRWVPEGAPLSRYVISKRQLIRPDVDEYAKALENAGLPLTSDASAIKTRIGRGGESVDEVLRKGAEMRKAVQSREAELGRTGTFAGLLPRRARVPGSYQELERVPENWRQLGGESPWARKNALQEQALQDSGEWLDTPIARHETPKVLANVRNTGDFLRGIGGPLTYNASMQRRFDMTKPIPEQLKRQLYQMELPGKAIEDMLPYDYPVRYASPKVIGALQQLAEKVPEFDELWSPDMLGKDVINTLSRTRKSSIEQLKLLKESGLPAMYFERAGHRNWNPLAAHPNQSTPTEFDPNKYNFVVFDQDMLPLPKRTEFAKGGVV